MSFEKKVMRLGYFLDDFLVIFISSFFWEKNLIFRHFAVSLLDFEHIGSVRKSESNCSVIVRFFVVAGYPCGKMAKMAIFANFGIFWDFLDFLEIFFTLEIGFFGICDLIGVIENRKKKVKNGRF